MDIKWPSFTGTATMLGSTPTGRVTVYYDSSGPDTSSIFTNAHDLLLAAPEVIKLNDAIFGTIGHHVNVIVFALGGKTDGTGGADHMACNYLHGGNIEVDAAFGQPERCVALFEAELSECSMRGNLCGMSTGEALSRWCAAAASNNALADFATAPTWAQHGMPNWVDKVDPSDRHFVSIGCGMAFISWLLSKGYTLPQIAPKMVKLGTDGTFAQLWSALAVDRASPWEQFVADAIALGSITIDDPFGAAHEVVASKRLQKVELA